MLSDAMRIVLEVNIVKIMVFPLDSDGIVRLVPGKQLPPFACEAVQVIFLAEQLV